MLASLVLAVLVLPVSAAPREAKVYAQAPWPYGAATGKGKELVLRSAADLVAASPQKKDETAPEEAARKVLADVTGALKVKNIDWKTQMLVVVRVERAHPFYPGAISRLEVGGRLLTVHYAYYAPVAARPQDAPPTPVSLSLLALVERFDGDVRFQPDVSYPK